MKLSLASKKIRNIIIVSIDTTKQHFAKCNCVKCNSFFLMNPNENPGELGYLCSDCSHKIYSSHVVQCSSCKSVINFVLALPSEEKVIFTIEKCSHCYGTIEDEWEVEPIYQSNSYV